MDMREALRIMSENPDKSYAWKGQAIKLLNVLSDKQVISNIPTDELLEHVESLDPIVRETFYKVEVDLSMRSAAPVSFHIKMAAVIIAVTLYLAIGTQGDKDVIMEMLAILSKLLDFLSQNAS